MQCIGEDNFEKFMEDVAILVLVDSVVQLKLLNRLTEENEVAILVLVDRVVQSIYTFSCATGESCRNPCFSGPCCAI